MNRIMSGKRFRIQCARHTGAAIAALVALAVPAVAQASGLQLNEHSAASMGMADSTIATASDPSAIFFNPAGITRTTGTEAEVGLMLIRPTATYHGVGLPSTNPTGQPVTQSTDQGFVPVPNAYVTRALSPKAFVGLGFYAPYGLAFKWGDPEHFVGRTVLQEINLRTYFFTPTIALKLSNVVSVAVGVSLVPATVYLKKALGAPDNGQVLFPASTYGSEGTVELTGSAFGVGANAGVQLNLDPIKVGFAFHSAVDLAFSGKAHFNLPSGLPAEIRANFPDGDSDTDITLPHSFSAGIGWVDGPLLAELSANLVLWNSIDQLKINFASGLPQPSTVTARNWNAVPTLRLGGQYQALPQLFVRAGMGFDFSPVPNSTIDPLLPDSRRLLPTIGLGYDFGFLRADVAYMALVMLHRDVYGTDGHPASVNFADGSYRSGLINLFSLSVMAKL